jgi:hypothetical protein
MARIPKRLAGPALVTNGALTKYTVPALTKTIVRHIHVQNPTALPVTFTASIGADAAGTRIVDGFIIPGAAAGIAASILDIFGYFPMDVGEILQALAGTNNVLTLTISGDEIVLG